MLQKRFRLLKLLQLFNDDVSICNENIIETLYCLKINLILSLKLFSVEGKYNITNLLVKCKLLHSTLGHYLMDGSFKFPQKWYRILNHICT